MNGIQLSTDLNYNIFSVLNFNWLKQKEKALISIVKVEGLANYKLKHVYHHLTPGVKLNLKQERCNEYGNMTIAVYYKDFKVGCLPKANNKVMANNLDNGTAFEVRVYKSIKDKYLPTEELYIEIEATK